MLRDSAQVRTSQIQTGAVLTDCKLAENPDQFASRISSRFIVGPSSPYRMLINSNSPAFTPAQHSSPLCSLPNDNVSRSCVSDARSLCQAHDFVSSNALVPFPCALFIASRWGRVRLHTGMIKSLGPVSTSATWPRPTEFFPYDV